MLGVASEGGGRDLGKRRDAGTRRGRVDDRYLNLHNRLSRHDLGRIDLELE